jgi:hypothetical protein
LSSIDAGWASDAAKASRNARADGAPSAGGQNGVELD